MLYEKRYHVDGRQAGENKRHLRAVNKRHLRAVNKRHLRAGLARDRALARLATRIL